jgi:hypothetical protein
MERMGLMGQMAQTEQLVLLGLGSPESQVSPAQLEFKGMLGSQESQASESQESQEPPA